MASPLERLRRVRERLAEAAQASGRTVDEVQLLAVTKTRSLAEIRALQELGLTQFGENRVAEAVEKAEALPGAEWHLIGHLQSNKAKACTVFSTVQSLDSPGTALALEKVFARENRSLSVLLEVNTGDEEQKAGTRSDDELFRLADAVLACPHLRWDGFMTMAPFTRDEKLVRGCFARLRETRDRLAARYPGERTVLSMGMSNDFEWAVREGSTLVRIGTALFEDPA